MLGEYMRGNSPRISVLLQAVVCYVGFVKMRRLRKHPLLLLQGMRHLQFNHNSALASVSFLIVLILANILVTKTVNFQGFVDACEVCADIVGLTQQQLS